MTKKLFINTAFFNQGGNKNNKSNKKSLKPLSIIT